MQELLAVVPNRREKQPAPAPSSVARRRQLEAENDLAWGTALRLPRRVYRRRGPLHPGLEGQRGAMMLPHIAQNHIIGSIWVTFYLLIELDGLIAKKIPDCHRIAESLDVSYHGGSL